MNADYRVMRLLASALACGIAAHAYAAEPNLPRDGWTSWEVPAVDGAPAWCCYGSWKDHDATPMTCTLDGGRQNGFGTRDNHQTTDSAKVYVRTTGGKIDRVQVLAASCPVETKTPIQSIDVTVDDSARWLKGQVKESRTDAVTGQPIGEGALAALAMHRGDLARDTMTNFARSDANPDTRKWSVFWLSMLRGPEGADITSTVMFNDQDSEVREHAAFALSQSKSPRKTQDLIRLGNTDKVGSVRARAWFWLAQTGAEGAEQAIVTALKKDADDDVREQGVFALSQLPGERATKALIAVAEDQSLTREQRKRAVFWLSQSQSDAAQAYLEKVLARL